jgi:site-specific DNA-methyltransferase (cytosine-N4-specific)
VPISKDRTISVITPGLIASPSPRRGERHLYGVDLNFAGVDTQYGTHAIHTYPAAMIPPLAKELIAAYIPKSGSVLDPFCGGGCVLVEALLAGRQCCGVEVNPLAVKISKAKTTYIDKVKILKQYDDIKEEALHLLDKVETALDKWTSFWFKPYMLQPLSALRVAISKIEDEDVRTLFEVVFSATVRDVMLTYRGEIRLRKLTGRDYERFNPDVFLTFQRRAQLAIERVSSLPEGAKADVKLQDARYMKFEDEKFTSIISSPPYGDDKNSVGYFQFSKNMLAWLGVEPSAIKEHRARFLGTEKSGKVAPPSMTLALSLEKVQERNDKHLEEAIAFYCDYYNALTQMVRVVKDRIIIVIGNRVLSRTTFDNANITLELLRTLGVQLQHYYKRSLRKKRIADLGVDGGGTTMEHILVFKK